MQKDHCSYNNFKMSWGIVSAISRADAGATDNCICEAKGFGKQNE